MLYGVGGIINGSADSVYEVGKLLSCLLMTICYGNRLIINVSRAQEPEYMVSSVIRGG